MGGVKLIYFLIFLVGVIVGVTGLAIYALSAVQKEEDNEYDIK